MKITRRQITAVLSAMGVSFLTIGCQPKETSLADRADGRHPEDFPELAIDVFQPMDGGIKLSPEEIKGRNTNHCRQHRRATSQAQCDQDYRQHKQHGDIDQMQMV